MPTKRKPASKATAKKSSTTRRTAVKKAAPAGNIEVKLALLTRDIEVKNIKSGTTLGQFLKDNNIQYNASIRVNTATVEEGYKLKKGDIVCVVTQVSGGSR